MKKNGFKSRILIPAAAVLILLFISFLAGVWFLQSNALEDDCSKNLFSCNQFFSINIEKDKKILSSLTDYLARDEMLRKLWLQHDRKALLQYASPILSHLQDSYNISHLYFIEPDQAVFLRCHQPERYGDLIDRFTMRQAVATQNATAGLEIGNLGTFSMRFVHPWYIDNRLVGYIEVSKEISNITREMQEIGGVGVVVLIDKIYLDNAGLAEGKGSPWHKLCWDIMPTEAVVYRHPDDLPDRLIAALNSCDLRDNKQASIDLKSGNKYRVGELSLFDAGGSDVGRIVIFQDVTRNIAATRLLEYVLGGVFVAVALVFLGLSYWYLGSIEKKLDKSNRKALDEAAAREQAKTQHLREMLRFEKALNGATDAICITDNAGCPLYYNAAFVELFDVPPEVSQGENVMLKIYPDQQFSETMFDKVTREQSYVGMTEILSRDDKPMSILIRGSAIVEDHGEVIGLLIIHTDITERIKTEDELRRQAAALRENNIALEKATLNAQSATLAKSEFLANMSHEIRTPMTAILGFSDVLLDPELNEDDRKKAIDIIRRNGQHLLQLINEVLDLSKIEAEKLVIELKECSISRLFWDLISLMQAPAQAKGLNITLECNGPIPETIHTDSTRLRQILINLLGNAIKFTEIGEVRLVAGVQRDNGGSILNIDVIDTGIGIPHDQLEEIFKPFTQADVTVTRKYGGSGLGLTICQRLATVLGGRITVESALGLGSTFRLSIPTGPLEGVAMIDCHEKHLRTLVLPDGKSQLDQKASLLRISGRILLAEDGPDNQTLISYILRKAGADVAVAENGRVAVDYIRDAKAKFAPFDLILMDMQMPVLDGYAATRELRSGGHDGPIIALTAHVMIEDREKCYAAGCDFYVSKPIQRETLVAVVAKFLPQPVEEKSRDSRN